MTNDYENLFAFVIIYGIPYYSFIFVEIVIQVVNQFKGNY